MEYILENEVAYLKISTKAAEITSFINKANAKEYMWQGNPKFWSGRNPILFPQVGNMWKKSYEAKGKTYKMGNHGFARHSEFTLVSQNDNQIILELKDNEDTYNEYPYHFNLKVSYTLVGLRLNIDYQITNLDEDVMPFGFGLHPAFNCPIDNTENYEDYHIKFDQKEEHELVQGDILPLTRDLFIKSPTVLLKGHNSNEVTLTNNKHSLKVGVKDFDILAIWTPSDAPFVCIEPWMSIGDTKESHIDFEKREYMLRLNPNCKYNKGYFIEIIGE